jgi:hypothetical protein
MIADKSRSRLRHVPGPNHILCVTKDMTGQEQTTIKAQVKLAGAWRQTTRVSLPYPDTRRIPATLLIAINGFLLVISLAALVRMWLP